MAERALPDEPEISIPPQYSGLPADVVEELWSVRVYADPEMNKRENARRARVLAQLRAEEAARAARDQREIADIRASLGVEVPPEPLTNEEITAIKNEAFAVMRKNPEANFLGLSVDLDEKGDLLDHTIDWKVGERFDAHGITKGTRSNPTLGGELDSLLGILNEGVDFSRDFHTAPLEVNPDDAAGLGAGLGSAGGSVRKDGSFVVVGGIDQKIRESGVRYVIVNPAYHGQDRTTVARLQKAFPTVEFIASDHANARLKEIAEQKGPAA